MNTFQWIFSVVFLGLLGKLLAGPARKLLCRLRNLCMYMAHVGHRGADGRYWGGDDYGWQSSESFKQLVGY
jgi:hypothetical protein